MTKYIVVIFVATICQASLAEDELFNEELMFSDIQDLGESSDDKILWGGNRQFTFEYGASYITTSPTEVATHRSSLRFKWNRVFNDFIYMNIDIKPILYSKGDEKVDNIEDSYDSETKVKEAYIQLNFGSTTVTVGDKIVIWGESQSGAVVDVISPKNLSDLAFTSLDESRIPQSMLMIDHYIGQSQINFIVNSDLKSDEDPPVESNNQALVSQGEVFDEKKHELAIRWKGVVGNGDLSLMAADLVDNRSVYRVKSLVLDQLIVDEFYAQYYMLAGTANWSFGRLSVELETAYNFNRSQQASINAIKSGVHPEGFFVSDEVISSLASTFQESGLRDWTVGYTNTHIFSDSVNLAQIDKDINELYISVSNKFLHETLAVSLAWEYVLETKENVQSLTSTYAYSDNLTMRMDLFRLKNLGSDDFNQDSVMVRFVYNF